MEGKFSLQGGADAHLLSSRNGGSDAFGRNQPPEKQKVMPWYWVNRTFQRCGGAGEDGEHMGYDLAGGILAGFDPATRYFEGFFDVSV